MWNPPLWARHAALAGADLLLIAVALFLAFLLRFEGAIPAPMVDVLWRTLVLSIGLKIPVFVVFQMYRFSWRHVGVSELLKTSLACAVGSSLVATAVLLLRHESAWGAAPRSALGIDFALTLLLVTWGRITPRLVAHLAGRGKLGRQATRAIIVGAGDAGAQLARALQQDPALTYHVVGFVDDDRRKRGMLLQGVRVLGSRKQLGAIVKSRSVRAVLIAMPSAQPGVIQETVTLARTAAVPDVKILPFLSELYAGRVSAADLRTLEPADVLHREEVRVDAAPIRAFLEGECVLVTGAAGSIGSELCRQILRFGVKRLVALDFDETGLFYLESELRHRFPEQEVDVVIDDVRDAAEIDALVERVHPDVVYHAAAYKHVPMMERFPTQAIKTNVEGTRNVLESSCRAGSKAFVLISTDKAQQIIHCMFIFEKSTIKFREKLTSLLEALEMDELSFGEVGDESFLLAQNLWTAEDFSRNTNDLEQLFQSLLAAVRVEYDKLPNQLRIREIHHSQEFENGRHVRDRETGVEYRITRDGGCVVAATATATEPVTVVGFEEINRENWFTDKGIIFVPLRSVQDIKTGMKLKKNAESEPLLVVLCSCGKVILCTVMCEAKFITTNPLEYEILSE